MNYQTICHIYMLLYAFVKLTIQELLNVIGLNGIQSLISEEREDIIVQLSVVRIDGSGLYRGRFIQAMPVFHIITKQWGFCALWHHPFGSRHVRNCLCCFLKSIPLQFSINMFVTLSAHRFKPFHYYEMFGKFFHLCYNHKKN